MSMTGRFKQALRAMLIAGAGLSVSGCALQAAGAVPVIARATAMAQSSAARPADQPLLAAVPPAGQQWLYGSAESAAASRQTYTALVDYTLLRAAARPADSVLLQDSIGIDAAFVPCAEKPYAVVLDADETLIWNLGAMRWFAENGIDFDPAVWSQWEQTGAGKAAALPGAVDALAKLRAAGITVIANSNRSAASTRGTEATLKAAGLGDFKHGETLFLSGDDAAGSKKDGRRETIGKAYCVLAMAGDQLGDFSDTFNAPSLSPRERKLLAAREPVAALWGKGWFLFSNPVYGPSIRGSFDDIFPAGNRWNPERGVQ